VEEIQEKVVKQGKRNVVSQLFHAKDDKQQIAAWRSDFDRILQIFNVRSIVTVWRLLTLDSQTELAIDTNVTVAETHNMVSNIHRTVVGGQGGSGGRNPLVSDTRSLYSTAE